MKPYYFLLTFFLLFTGCKKESFNIYKELEITDSDIDKSRNIKFLENIVVGGISYKDDKLTPDIIDGKLFGERNLTKLEITRYFIYNKNRTFDHRSSIFVDLNPKMVLYIKNYSDQDARAEQIKNFKFAIIIPPKRAERVKRTSSTNGDEFFLPKGLLPPRLPDLSIGVDNPDVPDL